jgi:hypothetical protein
MISYPYSGGLLPYAEEKATERKIGILDGKIKIEFKDDLK